MTEKETAVLAVSIAEAARMLSVSKSTLRSLVKSGILPAARIRRRVLLPMRAIEDFLSESTDQQK